MVHYGAGSHKSHAARIGKMDKAHQKAAWDALSTTSYASDSSRSKVTQCTNVSNLRAKKKEKYLSLHPDVKPADATQQLVEEWVVKKKGWKYAEHATEA
jgi:hypothetical protein